MKFDKTKSIFAEAKVKTKEEMKEEAYELYPVLKYIAKGENVMYDLSLHPHKVLFGYGEQLILIYKHYKFSLVWLEKKPYIVSIGIIATNHCNYETDVNIEDLELIKETINNIVERIERKKAIDKESTRKRKEAINEQVTDTE